MLKTIKSLQNFVLMKVIMKKNIGLTLELAAGDASTATNANKIAINTNTIMVLLKIMMISFCIIFRFIGKKIN